MSQLSVLIIRLTVTPLKGKDAHCDKETSLERADF